MGCTGGYATSDSGNVYTYWRVNVLIHPPLFVSFVIGAPPANHTCSTISLPSANIIHGQYRYIADLLHLATASSHSPYRTWPAYHSPIKMDQLAPFLASHPDQALASYIQMGLLTGFRIGYSRNRAQMRSRNTNHPSALRNKEVVDDKIAAELAAGRLLGPISPHILPLIHTSPLGLVPKAHHTSRCLGILIDSGNFELRLPADKLLRLHDAMSQYMRRSTCTRQELESLLGHLSHAATVIPQGRVFLRQLFSLLSLDRAPHHYIRFNAGAKADLMWWNTFLQDWNGSSFFPVMSTSIEVFSDASGTFGCGAFAHHHGWFQLQWPHEWHSIHITAKELVPVVIAAALWGHQWSRRGVCFRSDNMAVVDLLKTRTSRDPLLMHMLRCLAFYAAYYRFQLTAAHIPGVLNTAADALSRNNISLFHSLVPQSQQVSLPQAAVDLIVNSRPDWGSQAWTHLFTHSLTRESPQQPRQPISQDGSNTRNFASSST